MKHIIRKAYWNFEKEEKWINEMAAKGLSLDNYSWCKYTFTESEPGEYIYRIELLENAAGHPESQNYIGFLEDNGVEHVASYMRWVYLRKKTSEGKFDIYTDIESKIRHYSRIYTLWTGLGAAELCIGFSNLGIAVFVVSDVDYGSIIGINFIGGMLCTVIGILLLLLSGKYRKKIRHLKQEAEVHQ
jgi:hypothetical protein